MFMGEFHHNLDAKNRIIIPAKFREELGESFVITQGLEKCLFVYSLETWKKLTSKLLSLPFTKKDSRTFSRLFISGATECSFDQQGRIIITAPLLNFSNINKEVVIIGVNDRIELWSKEKWDAYLDDNQEQFESIAENLFEVNQNEA